MYLLYAVSCLASYFRGLQTVCSLDELNCQMHQSALLSLSQFLHSHHVHLPEEIPIFVWLLETRTNTFSKLSTRTSDLVSVFLSLGFCLPSAAACVCQRVMWDQTQEELFCRNSSLHAIYFEVYMNHTACIRATNKDEFQINGLCIISGMFIFSVLTFVGLWKQNCGTNFFSICHFRNVSWDAGCFL